MLLIGNIFTNAASANPTAVAATLDDEKLTFGQLDDRSNRLANGLTDAGLGRGDRVLWWSDTDLEAVTTFAALAKLGAVFAPLNARASVEEVAPVARYAQPRMLLAGASHRAAAVELARAVKVDHLAELPYGDDTAPAATALDERDPHVIFFTSGSTGAPKGVVLSHRVNWLRTFAGGTTSTGGGGVVCMFPLFHMAAWTIALGAWQARRAIHFVMTPDAATLLRTVERHRATRLYCIPAVWARIIEQGIEQHDLSSLVEADTGTSATPPELLRAIKDALPHTATRVFYGSTEAGPTLQLADADLFRKPGSVGTAAPAVDVRLSPAGEVCVRSSFLMDGYFDAPEATAEAVPDGWYHSGDLGSVDEDGYISIVGRVRDVIRSGGETIAPAEVEHALVAHPAVADVAVVGMPDAQWGEIVTAVVVVEAGEVAPDVAALRDFCAGRLAPFKQPRRVEIADVLPRTPATGQVQRTLLVERLSTRPA